MTDPAFEALLQEFKQAAPRPTPSDPMVTITSITLGVPVVGEKAAFNETITIVDGISAPLITRDEQGRHVHTFVVINEWLTGTATVIVDERVGTLSCDASELIVCSPYLERGFSIASYELGYSGIGGDAGDFDGDSMVRKKKSNKQGKRRLGAPMMKLLSRAQS